MQVQAMVSELTVEAFHERVLCWLAGLDKMQLDLCSLRSEEYGLAGELGAVITNDGLR